MKKQIVIGDFGPSPVALYFWGFRGQVMEPLVRGVTDEIQTFFAFVVGKGLRAQRLPAKVGKEAMAGKTMNALTPIDASGGKVFVEGEYWSATSDTFVKKGQPVQIIAVEGLTVKVKPET